MSTAHSRPAAAEIGVHAAASGVVGERRPRDIAARPRSTADIAAVLGRSVTFTEQLLRDEQARGNVERVGDGWTLTAAAAEKFADGLALIGPDV
jgi:hypothetical protein